MMAAFQAGLNGNKAGMQGLDKDRIQSIVSEATSVRYQAYLTRKEAQLKERIRLQTDKVNALTPAQLEASTKQMDGLLEELESCRQLDSVCVVVDMDAYFAAVEMRDSPHLRHIPMAVGSLSMLGTSNYAARRFGVRAAQPGFVALRLCPQLRIVPGNYDKYSKVSSQVRAVLMDYDPELSMHSLDEAYMDITQFLKLRNGNPVKVGRTRFAGECECRLPRVNMDNANSDGHTVDLETTVTQCEQCQLQRITVRDTVEFGGTVEDVVNEMRFMIEQRTGLTASAGIAANHTLAKIASDFNKPNGQYRVQPDRQTVMHFINPLPIRKIPGIGGVQEALLNALNVHKCSDIHMQRAFIGAVLSQANAQFLMRTFLGVTHAQDADTAVSDCHPKSVSVERTFSNESDPEKLSERLIEYCTQLSEECAHKQLKGYTITVKMKSIDFENMSRSKSVSVAMNDRESITSLALSILHKQIQNAAKPLELRLLGVKLSNFEHNPQNEQCNKLTDFWPMEQQPSTSTSYNNDNEDKEEEFENKNEEGGEGEWMVDSQSQSLAFLVQHLGETDDGAAASDCTGHDLHMPTTTVGNDESQCQAPLPSKSTFQCVSPSESTSQCVSPSKSTFQCVSPSESTSQCVSPSKSTSQCVSPTTSDIFECPICLHRLPQLKDNTQRTLHVERCLSRQTVQQLIKEQINTDTDQQQSINNHVSIDQASSSQSNGQGAIRNGMHNEKRAKRKQKKSDNVSAVKSMKIDTFVMKS